MKKKGTEEDAKEDAEEGAAEGKRQKESSLTHRQPLLCCTEGKVRRRCIWAIGHAVDEAALFKTASIREAEALVVHIFRG